MRSEERRTRIRLGESLQMLRPTMSVKGKQPAAEAAPTLYDIVREKMCYLFVSSCALTCWFLYWHLCQQRYAMALVCGCVFVRGITRTVVDFCEIICVDFADYVADPGF